MIGSEQPWDKKRKRKNNRAWIYTPKVEKKRKEKKNSNLVSHNDTYCAPMAAGIWPHPGDKDSFIVIN